MPQVQGRLHSVNILTLDQYYATIFKVRNQELASIPIFACVNVDAQLYIKLADYILIRY